MENQSQDKPRIGLVEIVLIVLVIAIVIVGILTLLGPTIGNMYPDIGGPLNATPIP